MQSMHQVRTLNSVAPHVQQQLIQQELNSTGQQQQQDQLSMTVLESLEPAQTGQQQQTVIHHLAPAPLLHQLQPSNRQLIEQQQHELDFEQQELSQRNEDIQLQQAANNSNRTTSRQNRASGQQPLEGIVADGGGPIVQWLLENYEIADGESLPRSTVYNHYLAHCRSLRMSSVNAASFGKLIRSVFVGLKTRRLGTRGHSKYHYFGVRAKQHVRFDWLHESTGTSSANSEGGGARAGCSSAAMLRDSNLNCDTNSNCGSDGAGQCGSETDSTGNCSGRLSTSISTGGHLNQINGTNTNGTDPTATTTSAATTNLNNVHSNKRLKRMQVVTAAPDDHYHHVQHQARQEHNLGASLDQQHLHQVHYTHQGEQSAANGLQYHQMVQSNGYDKQDLFACTVAIGADEQHDFSQWSNTQLNQYDLANLRNHLNLEKASSLVNDHWPEREPDLLERLLGRQRGASGANDERESGSAGASDSQDCRLERLLEPFESQYKFHYKRLVELLSELNFVEIERLWADFWRPQATGAHWSANPVELNDDSAQRRQQQQTNSNYDQQQQQRQDSTPGGQLTFGQLYELTSRPAIVERIAQIDQRLFAAIEKFLVVDMLNPLPRALIQHLRSFARQVCGWQEAAIKDYCAEFVAAKIRSARAFELALRRSTSINHLSAAACAIWSKRSVLSQMSIDLSRLDLSDLEHQVASLMDQEKFQATTLAEAIVVGGRQNRDDQLDGSQRHSLLPPTASVIKAIDGHDRRDQHEADEKTVNSSGVNIQEANDNIENTYTSQQHLNSIISQQQQQNHLGNNSYNCTQPPNTTQTNSTANFLIHFDQTSPLQPGQLVQNFLHLLNDPFPAGQWPNWCRALVESRVSGRSLAEARDFILKWNFYISLILRELTLKSAPSLGSFQLIRLLFDEFMYFLVLSKLQQAATQSADGTKAKFHQNQHSI